MVQKQDKTVGRPRKEGEYINCYCKKELTDELNQLLRETDIPKTVAVEHALKLYLDRYKETGAY